VIQKLDNSVDEVLPMQRRDVDRSGDGAHLRRRNVTPWHEQDTAGYATMGMVVLAFTSLSCASHSAATDAASNSDGSTSALPCSDAFEQQDGSDGTKRECAEELRFVRVVFR
jgi:hypothetical protein